MAIRDNNRYIRVLLYSYYTTITRWEVFLNYTLRPEPLTGVLSGGPLGTYFSDITKPKGQSAGGLGLEVSNAVKSSIWDLRSSYFGTWTLREPQTLNSKTVRCAVALRSASPKPAENLKKHPTKTFVLSVIFKVIVEGLGFHVMLSLCSCHFLEVLMRSLNPKP